MLEFRQNVGDLVTREAQTNISVDNACDGGTNKALVEYGTLKSFELKSSASQTVNVN